MRTALRLAALALPATAFAQVTPGKWEIVTTVNSVDMPGAPPFVANMMKGKPIKVSHCLTPEEAAKGPQEMMKARKECRFTRYAMVGGKLLRHHRPKHLQQQAGVDVLVLDIGFRPSQLEMRVGLAKRCVEIFEVASLARDRNSFDLRRRIAGNSNVRT